MKKAFLSLMAVCVLLLPLQNVALAEPDQPEEPVLSAEGVEYEPGCVPAGESAAGCASPLLRAALFAMLNQDCARFSADSRELAWESLYNLLSICGQLDERSRYEGGELLLPAELVRDYAVSLVPGLSGLGEIPEALSDRIAYRAADDSYLVVCGDDGIDRLELSAPVWEGGGVRLDGSLVFSPDGTELAAFRAVLLPADNLMGFTLSAMELL